MTSLNEQVNQLHTAYLDATGYELALNGVDERRWFDAAKFGVSPDDVKLVVKARIRGITLGDRKPASIYLRNLIGDEDVLAEFAMELAAIRATQRKKLLPPGQRDVLEATGRPGEPDSPKVRHVSEVFETMKNAVK